MVSSLLFYRRLLASTERARHQGKQSVLQHARQTALVSLTRGHGACVACSSPAGMAWAAGMQLGAWACQRNRQERLASERGGDEACSLPSRRLVWSINQGTRSEQSTLSSPFVSPLLLCAACCLRVCLVTTKFPNFPSHPSHLLSHRNIKYSK